MKEKRELTRRDRLLKELDNAAQDVDEEGLVFLIEQANVLLHNARVRELDAKRAAEGPPEGPGDAGSGSQRKARRPPARASIEQSPDGKAFFLVLGNVRKSMARSELNSLLKICVSSPDGAEAARRLWAHLGRERRDILVDAGITDSKSPLLVGLAEHARKLGGKKGES